MSGRRLVRVRRLMTPGNKRGGSLQTGGLAGYVRSIRGFRFRHVSFRFNFPRARLQIPETVGTEPTSSRRCPRGQQRSIPKPSPASRSATRSHWLTRSGNAGARALRSRAGPIAALYCLRPIRCKRRLRASSRTRLQPQLRAALRLCKDGRRPGGITTVGTRGQFPQPPAWALGLGALERGASMRKRLRDAGSRAWFSKRSAGLRSRVPCVVSGVSVQSICMNTYIRTWDGI